MFTHGFARSISEIAENSTVITDQMMTTIDEWLEMYEGNAPWLNKNPQSLGLPAIIASEIARLVTLEMQVNITGSEMADYIMEQFDSMKKDLRTNIEYACAGGGIVFKPYICDDRIVTEIVHANSFYPIAFNNAQQITSAYFIYRKWSGKKIYSRLEKHELYGEKYIITNKAYVSTVEDALGKECLLTDVEGWDDIAPEVTLEGVKSPLFSYFKIPIGNVIDIRSPLGASIYSKSVGLIMEADKQWQRYLWEYEGGELAIEASSDAFIKVNGKPLLPEGKERLYRMNNLDAVATGGADLLKPWAPALRDSNYGEGLNNILKRIEDSCSLARGTLSEVELDARTATEIKMTKQRSYATVSDIQLSLQDALNNLAYAMYCLATLYDLCPAGDYETAYVWDDSIIVDAEAERLRDQQEVAQGLMMKYEYRMKWYGEDEATAKAKLKEGQDPTDDQIMGFIREPDAYSNNRGSNPANNPNEPKNPELQD